MEDKTLSGKGKGSISPNYYVSPEFPNKILTIKTEKEPYEIDKILDNDIETKISVYEDRANGWFLDFARKLTKETNSEFVVLMICVNYLEGNQQFREGRTSLKRESTEMLKRALKRVLSEVEENAINLFIDKVRHGLSHDGMTRRGALLRYGLGVVCFTFTIDNEEWIELDPSLFLKEVQRDFEEYICILRNKENKVERENFEKHYKERYESPDI
ncbi:MAG: hypothetical protein IIA87_05055 [Nanoarchaeota archaeon]|nr:hypothetical protein [Nanoarchaeota archaeon]